MPIATRSDKIDISSEAKTEEFALKFLKKIKTQDIIFLYGEIGVGKTTFVRYLINESGSELGKRFYLGTGVVIPGNSVLTSDPFFLDGELYKSHRHFSLSSGAYKGIIEGQLFLKRN